MMVAILYQYNRKLTFNIQDTYGLSSIVLPCKTDNRYESQVDVFAFSLYSASASGMYQQRSLIANSPDHSVNDALPH